MRHLVERALSTMSDHDHQLLQAVLEEKSREEISRDLNIKQSCIPVMLHRARRRLRERLSCLTNAVREEHGRGRRTETRVCAAQHQGSGNERGKQRAVSA
jgi:FixJ family two-component response regulator